MQKLETFSVDFFTATDMDPPNENKDKQSSVLMDIIDIEDVAPIELPKKANDINWKVLKNFQTALKCFDSTEQAEKAIQHVFNSLPSTETETENTSIARTVPVAADVLLRMMSDAVR